MNLRDLPSEADLNRLSKAEKIELLELLEEREERALTKASREHLIPFCHKLYPGFKEGPQHRKIAQIFEDVLAGRKKRVIINIAPRMGKSEFSSYLFPSFFLGQNPDQKIIMATHTASLSEDFGRRVRNLIQSPEYEELFPGTAVSHDQKAAGKWSTAKGGQYYAVGVGGALAGRGADLLLIDDPHSEQDVRTNSKATFESCWAWYQTGPLQRLMPGGAIVVIMCMTGDTPVLMADGTEKPLRDVRPGDTVATYEDGQITTSRINNHRSNGVDDIFTIATRSGKILRANERHPFLVDLNGVRTWIRLRDLKPGMSLVATKDALAPRDHRPSRDSAIPAKPKPRTTERIPLRRITQWAITVSGRTSSANAANLSPRSASVLPATVTSTTAPSRQQHSAARDVSSTATASRWSSIKQWLQNAAGAAISAASFLQTRTPALIGAASSASTIATTPGRFAGYSATTATSPSDTAKPQRRFCSPLSTFGITLDEIVNITPAGREEVFDVEIERTENFIANGVVSHNTRWASDDLTGKILDWAAKNGTLDEWEVVELPAILPSGASLWPEQWSVEELLGKKNAMDSRYWSAQYMQNPTSEEGALIKREWWRVWPETKPPKVEFIIQSWDTAFTKSETADYSACTTWGIFQYEDPANGIEKHSAIILLDAFKERMEFPELKKTALKHYTEWKPDAFIIEGKAAGLPLIHELRAQDIPVQEFTPSRGNDKTVRVNAVSDLFSSGMVWRPDTRWAKDVAEECAAFPHGDNDDYVDCTTQALLRYRKGGFITLPSDAKDDPQTFKPRNRTRSRYAWS